MDNLVHVQSFANSLNKANEELCGDKVEIRLNDESFVMVLADGLGSGVKANILSTLTSTIISEMIEAGSSIEDVVETITATLPECKERHIAYATFTILQVFYDGTAHLVEFDNPPSIVLRNRKFLNLEKEIKVIGNRTIYESTFDVVPDDIIVFFSDGIIHAGIGTVLNLGWDHPQVVDFLEKTIRNGDSAQIVNHLLLNQVNGLYGGHCGDDSTVAVAKILKATETVVLVGPPIDMSDDKEVVQRLMNATGKKICCGGTTSNIVARETNQSIEIKILESVVSDVPPIAHIDGIDLVTEGVLTLGKVNEHLTACVNIEGYLDELSCAKSTDGATLLCKMLLNESSKISFIVGCSDNPAHKAIAYSTISINAKIHLIDKIANNLRELGKIVVIEHY